MACRSGRLPQTSAYYLKSTPVCVKKTGKMRQNKYLSLQRIFSVEIATSARMMVMIQNRTMIFGSATPFNSK
jgi:hypothetical protein